MYVNIVKGSHCYFFLISANIYAVVTLYLSNGCIQGILSVLVFHDRRCIRQVIKIGSWVKMFCFLEDSSLYKIIGNTADGLLGFEYRVAQCIMQLLFLIFKGSFINKVSVIHEFLLWGWNPAPLGNMVNCKYLWLTIH